MVTKNRRTELHRHLDASIRAKTLAELTNSTEEKIKTEFWLTEQMSSLKEVLDRFVLFQKVLKSTEILERISFEAVEDAKAEGIDKLELRYSPTFTSELSNIPWDDALRAILAGLHRGQVECKVEVGLLCIVTRDYGEKEAHKTIDFAIQNQHEFVGIDLAGNEIGYPAKMFKEPFKKAIHAGFSITSHSGEAAGPEEVWDAIDILGATRIGHGINSIKDNELIKRLARDRILLETCPTSNYITKSVKNFEDHPLPKFLERDVPVSISTDDPGIFGVTMGEEYARCKEKLGLTDKDIEQVNVFADRHSFIRSR